MNNKNLTFNFREHRVFIARSKLWSTSQSHTRNRLQCLFILSCQYSWDYRHEHEGRK